MSAPIEIVAWIWAGLDTARKSQQDQHTDEDLSTSINLNAFEPLVLAAKKAGVKRFVYASSSSVYGVSDNPDVTEDHPLVPLTLYNKYSLFVKSCG